MTPWPVFRSWLEEARSTGSPWAGAMVLATATAGGRPSARAMMLRHVDESGLAFDSDYRSRKAQDLGANPRAAAVFLWPDQERQARFEGEVEAVTGDESDQRFRAAARDQQLAIWASTQSKPVEGSTEVRDRIEQLRAEHEGRPVPRPEWWGGYRLRPTTVELWQGRPDRVHDRLVYRLEDDGTWSTSRLSP